MTRWSLQGRQRASTATWWCVTAGIRPNVGLGVVSGLTVERAIVVDDQMRSRGRPRRLRRRRVRPAPRRGLRPGRAAVGAGRRCWPTTSPARTRRPPTTARGSPPSSRWRASTWRRWGSRSPRSADDEFVQLLRAQARHLQDGRHPRRQADRRDAARRHQEGRVPDAELRPRAAAARGARRAAVRPRRRRREESGAAEMADDGAGLQLQRRVQGRSRRVRARRRAQRHGL